MWYVSFRWEFVSDEEAWISTFHVKGATWDEAVNAGERLLLDMNKRMYLGEEIKIVKKHASQVEEGFIREWRPKR